MNFITKINYKFLAFLAKRIIKKNNPKIIGVVSTDEQKGSDPIFRVFNDHAGSGVYESDPKMCQGVEIPLAVLGFQRRPFFLSWLFIGIQSLYLCFKKNFPKYLILNILLANEKDLLALKSWLKLDTVIVLSRSPFEFSRFADIIKDESTFVINADSIKKADIFIKAKVITVGIDNKIADYQAENIRKSASGLEYRITTTGRKISINSKAKDERDIYPELCAFALGQTLKIQSLKIKDSLEK